MSEPEPNAPPSAADAPQKAPVATPAPKWRPISAIDRRVLGVLVEKSKTTPDAYPLTLNALVTGANQKSNRHPLMQLDADDVQESVDRLREIGAMGILQGNGRVDKFRHFLYDWLGVEKVELSIMGELLLRGPQTEGELRIRASRMDPIDQLSELRTRLDSLKAKGLVLFLTGAGRGQVVTHALYEPRELARLQSEYVARRMDEPASESRGPAADAAGSATRDDQPPQRMASAPTPPSASKSPRGESDSELEDLRRLVESLRRDVEQLKSDRDEGAAKLDHAFADLARIRDGLGI